MGIALRKVKPREVILPEDHNSLVDAFLSILNDDKELSVYMPELESKISKLEEIASKFRRVKYGDYVLADDHNTLVDFVLLQLDFDKEVLQQVIMGWISTLRPELTLEVLTQLQKIDPPYIFNGMAYASFPTYTQALKESCRNNAINRTDKGKITVEVLWQKDIMEDCTLLGQCFADIDADGVVEMVVGDFKGKLGVIDPDGSVEWLCSTDTYVHMVFLYDVDGDGLLEIIVSTTNGVKCYSRDGKELWFANFGEHGRFLEVADIDNDGIPEVLSYSDAGVLRCLNGRDGSIKWSYTTGSASTIGVADFEGKGYYNIAIGSGADDKVYFLDHLGNLIWEYVVLGQDERVPLPPIVIEDVDGDGQLELLFPVYDDDGYFTCLSKDGSEEWKYAYPKYENGSHGMFPIEDWDGDGEKEVFVTIRYEERIDVLHGSDGSLEQSLSLDYNGLHPGLLADINDDGKFELITRDTEDNVYAFLNDGSRLWKYTPPRTFGTQWYLPAATKFAEDINLVCVLDYGEVVCLT